MPKLKTHSGTKDRVKISKTGKALARRGGGNHLLEKKSMSRKRTYKGLNEITGHIKRNIKRKLGA
jgi:large subunit ribosomal protein L35